MVVPQITTSANAVQSFADDGEEIIERILVARDISISIRRPNCQAQVGLAAMPQQKTRLSVSFNKAFHIANCIEVQGAGLVEDAAAEFFAE